MSWTCYAFFLTDNNTGMLHMHNIISMLWFIIVWEALADGTNTEKKGTKALTIAFVVHGCVFYCLVGYFFKYYYIKTSGSEMHIGLYGKLILIRIVGCILFINTARQSSSVKILGLWFLLANICNPHNIP